ncbi:uncharacterized protein LOC106169678 [Lingula anatina]|uniref:Uncharacterized protein LOC106169678 n=1 Tax=Lingula anatina TaxID=7574 RepID=A0A1S3J2S5_LINAN|nr:uncharacterized protein LOC106169678 [Lingula anatina]XP_013404711.1 uncharacterized protein LOC106169678 [Lingula anatina]XP_013404712.1 uncharacterized protein LOC106169678 [Lingula anatina]XP_013404714.1 uncharacterized protein LOC106169678 [Lingula anatina]|eukprot:XP_013404710.1 uncharacterized protein LOC106169678 [Lingula anatina]
MIAQPHWDVYVASSEEDDHLVEPLVNEIQSHSYVCFRAHKDIIPGQNEIQARDVAMKEARKVLLYLTNNFLKDGWCEMERGVAMIKAYDKMENPSNDIVLIPVIKDLNPHEIPETLKALRCIDVDKDDRYMDRIIAALQDPQLCWAENFTECPNCSRACTKSGSALDLHIWFNCQETQVCCPTGHCPTVLRRSQMKIHVQRQHRGEHIGELHENIYETCTARMAKGKFRYERKHKRELSFNTGDIFQILNDSHHFNWWLVKDHRDQRVGYVPKNFLEIEECRVVPALRYPQRPALPAPGLPTTQPYAITELSVMTQQKAQSVSPSPSGGLCLAQNSASGNFSSSPEERLSSSYPGRASPQNFYLTTKVSKTVLPSVIDNGTLASWTRQMSHPPSKYQRVHSISESGSAVAESMAEFEVAPPPDFSVHLSNCDRRQAKKILKKHGQKGAYLLRQKSRADKGDHDVCCVLSVFSPVGNDHWKPKHYEIKRTEDNMYCISEHRSFESLEQLVWFYKGHRDGLNCQLTEPVTDQN